MTELPIGGFHEQNANSIIADWLNDAGRDWHASAERTHTLIGSNARPDIIIRQGDRMPVIPECEFGNPAVSDATGRLGQTLIGETRPFTEVIAVGISETCQDDTPQGFRQRLDDNEQVFTVQLVTVSDGVWPRASLPATPADLAAHCEYAQVPQAVIDRQSENIAQQIVSAGQKLHESIRLTGRRQHDTLIRLRDIVGCEQDTEATCTACAVWLIAIDLQNDLATHSSALQDIGLPTTQELRDTANGILRPADLLEAWRTVEEVDYLPVVDLAINSLQAGAMGTGLTDILLLLERLSTDLNGLHAKHIYNFAGELWQRLVGDREERAAHYTKPEVAELLATLSAQRFQDRSSEQMAKLDLWDAACGTGTLIGAGERALRRLYALRGGRDPELHRQRMQEHIMALDVNGIAGTLTAKRLTDLNVTQDYAKSKIAIVTHEAGSLFLLNPVGVTGIADHLGYGGVAATPGLDTDDLGIFHIAYGSVAWALMNPPYSRPRGGRRQVTTGLAPLRRAAAKAGYTMSNGQAGLASDFGNMSHLRMAPGGTFAHVLPLTAAHAKTWHNWRFQMEKDFEHIVAIANVGSDLESMSADTAMNEMLVVATKRQERPLTWEPTSILCVNLNTAPASLSQGYAIAQEIAGIAADRDQGTLQCGSYIRTATPTAGFPWFAVGTGNPELTAVVAALMRGNCYDPLTLTQTPLALDGTALGDLAATGPTHHLIGHLKGNEAIGAFEWTPLDIHNSTAAQKSMWSADAKRQTTIMSEPTHAGTVVDQDLAERMALERSSWFISRNLRWTSQAIAIAKTRQRVHGGRAWNDLQDLSDDIGQCLALYFNSTFGAIVRTAYGQSTQSGRATIQVGAIGGLPCPDFAADTPDAQHARDVADQYFDALAWMELQPFAYCFRDSNRHQIDLVVAEMLGLDPADTAVHEMLEHYRLLFSSEPNVNGRQKSIVKALEQHQEAPQVTQTTLL